MRRGAALLLGALALTACHAARPKSDDTVKSSAFPPADRPVAPIVSPRFSTEEDRDSRREAATVMDVSGVKRGMTVADIGAGEGYYTVRLAARVGRKGRVLAEDVVPQVRDRLAERVTRDRLDNVSVKLGEPANAKLPAGSFDRIFLVHMYHEIEAPYEFLWRMRPALAPGGEVVVVDADRPPQDHGTPPTLLDCEMRAVGYARVKRVPLTDSNAFLALYEAQGERPEPNQIRACVRAPETRD